MKFLHTGNRIATEGCIKSNVLVCFAKDVLLWKILYEKKENVIFGGEKW